ncbi:uncharacterized protein LOC121398352 [Xenopus laevis]|uniref:Uncharacterized protein LOC121398352 n=1 Tax=Xenopus laevis TaxID=8355 RepID=A0A8J1LWP2_XENLA|nr:uncharacterized protein LOC121398352 [Xenopus laevis]
MPCPGLCYFYFHFSYIKRHHLSALPLLISGHEVSWLLGRKMDKITQLTDLIKNFSFADCAAGNLGYDRVLLQLFGFLGHGKSSFINTCKYVLEDGKYHNYTNSEMSLGGDTKVRITYPLTETMTLVDNRGCSVMNEYETAELYAQLANLLPLDKGVEWNQDFGLADRIVEAESVVKSSDFIYPIFIFSVNQRLPHQEITMIKELLEKARDLTEIFPTVVLTHKTEGDLRDMKAKFENMGVERIFALENFTPEDHIKTRGRHEDVLEIFSEIIKDIKFHMERAKDPPEQKRIERKKHLLNMVHKREMEKKEEEIESQRMKEKRLQKEMEDLQRKAEQTKQGCLIM